ncbi:MAG: mannan endo-1,4-beta-mannosidase [Sphingobacteriia bacterium]|nr:MAG: mannan endo-1,4-beta-mannosidase [Sphingobacteriia bacterium]
MKNILFLPLLFIALITLSFNDQKGIARKTCYVNGRFLYAPNGEKIILRGINKMNVVTDPTGEKSFPEIAKTGANTVRIMWATWGGNGEKLDIIIGNCIKHQMIPIIELHDATGKWNKLDECVDFWLQKDVVTIIQKYQRHLLLNIANEAGTDTVSQHSFAATYGKIVRRMRGAGIHIPLMIDAANWGRNESYILTNSKELVAADPLHNLIFSWHIWDAGISETRIETAIQKSIQLNINLLIGEFAPIEVKCKCCIPYKFILQYCQQQQIGWLAWSWGVGNSDCAAMDMTKTESFESLFDWGLEVAVTDLYSIKNTSSRPFIFSANK